MRGMLLTPRGIDKSDFMTNVINNIKSNTQIVNFTIVHDYKFDSIYSKLSGNTSEYHGINLIVSPTSIRMPSQLSASLAFKLGLKNLSKDYLLFWEHDHLFVEKLIGIQ